MTHVLILWIYLGSNGISVTTQEFTNKESCESAALAVYNTANIFQGVKHVCVPKMSDTIK